jgi:signal transduction histidine kinase
MGLALACLTTVVNAQPGKIDSLERVLAGAEPSESTAKTIIALVNELARTNQPKAKAYTHEALQMSRQVNSSLLESNALNYLVTINQDLGLADSARYYMNLFEQFALKQQGPARLVILINFNQAAGLYYKNSGNYTTAIPYQKAAIKYARERSDKTSIAGMLLNLGNTYSEMGQHKQALTNRMEALKLFEEVHNDRGISFCYQGIAQSFYELKQYNRALEYANLSRDIKTSMKDTRGLHTSNSLIGQIYAGLHRFSAAEQAYNDALQIAAELKLVRGSAQTHYNKAILYKEYKFDSLALVHFDQSMTFSRQMNDTGLYAIANREKMLMEKNQVSMGKQEALIQQSLQLSERAGKLNDQQQSHQLLSEHYQKQGNYALALKHLQLAYKLRDSMTGFDQQVALAKLEEEYNRDRKEKEIEILQRDKALAAAELSKRSLMQWGLLAMMIMVMGTAYAWFSRYRLRQKTNQQLALARVRSDIARDLHDEVGSSISSISMMSGMALEQQGQAEKLTHLLQKVKEYASETVERMSDIVWMIKPEEDGRNPLSDRMRKVLADVQANYGITVETTLSESDTLMLDLGQKRNIYLIFKEAVNNALKYSSLQRLTVDLQLANGELKLQVSDDGTGFDMVQSGRGNGISNMHKRAADLGGKLMVDSNPSGTAVLLTVPLGG